VNLPLPVRYRSVDRHNSSQVGAQARFDIALAPCCLQIFLASGSVVQISASFIINQLERTAIPRGPHSTSLVFIEPAAEIVREAHVIVTVHRAPDHIDVIEAAHDGTSVCVATGRATALSHGVNQRICVFQCHRTRTRIARRRQGCPLRNIFCLRLPGRADYSHTASGRSRREAPFHRSVRGEVTSRCMVSFGLYRCELLSRWRQPREHLKNSRSRIFWPTPSSAANSITRRARASFAKQTHPK